MAAGLQNQIERWITLELRVGDYREIRSSWAYSKTLKHRRERRRAKANPECQPEYRRFWGWEY